MAHRVDLTERATRDLRHLRHTIEADRSPQAATWFEALQRLILSLAENPTRGSITPENETCRHVFHGRRPHAYRVIYRIDSSTQTVTILHIRHGRRDAFE